MRKIKRSEECIGSYKESYSWITEDEDGNKLEEGYYDESLDSIYWEDCKYEMDKVLLSKSYIMIDGNSGTWRGFRKVDMIITSMSFSDLASEYLNMENVEIEVFEDRVSYINYGHDATSRYDFIPIDLMDLTKDELLGLVEPDEYKYDTNRKPDYESKETLVNYIEEIGI